MTALIGLLLIALVTVGGFGVYVLRADQDRSAAHLRNSQQMLRAIDITRASEVSFKLELLEYKNILLRGQEKSDYDKHLSGLHLEFRKEDPSVPIRPEHKMSVDEVRAEVTPQGYRFEKVVDTLPWQHIIFFRKAESVQ